MSKKIKIVLLSIIGLVVLVLFVFSLLGYFVDKSLDKPLLSPKEQEIQKIQELVKAAQESGQKEPLITLSKDGFSHDEIKIKPNSFISFYNSTSESLILKSDYFGGEKEIKSGVTASIKFKQETEIKIGDKILKIYIE